VVAMGGYNTVCEILASGTRALVVPRAEPRREQLIRARRLSELGALDVLEPQRLTAAALSRWLADGGAERPAPRPHIDMDGLSRIPALLDKLLATPDDRPGHGAVTPAPRFTHETRAIATSTRGVPE